MLECNKKHAVLHCCTLQHTSRNSFLWIRLHETLWISLRLPAVTCSIYCVYMLIYIRQGCSPLHCFLLLHFFTHTSPPAGSQQGEKGWVTDNHAWILYSKWGMNRLAWTITFIFLKWCFSLWLSAGESHTITNKWPCCLGRLKKHNKELSCL